MDTVFKQRLHTYYRLAFVAVLVLAVLLRFWGLWGQDILSDPAHYTFRALGWFDFLDPSNQTSPVIWFGAIPWWARFSFHDAPPLVFFIQNIFMKVFGQSSFSVLLPFALAGVLTTSLIYVIVKKFKGAPTALLASLLFAVSSYAVWMGRSGYLEGIEVLWIVLSLFFLLRVVDKKNSWDIVWFCGATALALLSKYTALYLIPAGIITILIWGRKNVSIKKLCIGIALFFTILTLVIIYNWMVFATRGHFDVALSAMLGMHPADYKTIAARSINAHIWSNLSSIATTLSGAMSLLFFLLMVSACVWACVRSLKKQTDILLKIIVVNIIALSGMFAFSGVAARYLPIIMPYLSIVGALFISFVFAHIKPSAILLRRSFIIGCALIIILELLYTVNTNIAENPVGISGIAFSAERFYATGHHDLDLYLRKSAYGTLQPMKKIDALKDASPSFDPNNHRIILLDQRSDWFPNMWYFERYRIYYKVPFLIFTDVFKLMREENNTNDLIGFLKKLGITDVRFIYTMPEIRSADYGSDYDNYLDKFEAVFEKANIKPIFTAHTNTGKESFRVFQFSLQDTPNENP